jgi:MATE family multidrug resistance protein
MGIAGAAWGTLAAVTYRTLRLGLTLVAPSVHEEYGSRKMWAPSWSCMKGLLRVGLPCSLQWLCDVFVWAVFVNVLIGARFGTVHLIATNTAWQYMRIAFLPTLGVGQSLTALVGKSIGAGDPDRAIRETRIAAVITLCYMGSLSLLYWLMGTQLIMVFNSDPEVVRIGATIMIYAAVFQLFDGIAICYNSALRGAGDTFVPSMFFIASNWVIIVGGGWFVAETFPDLGCLGPWLAASCLIIITGVFLWCRWHSRAWMRINLFRTASGSGGKSRVSRPNDAAGTASDCD